MVSAADVFKLFYMFFLTLMIISIMPKKLSSCRSFSVIENTIEMLIWWRWAPRRINPQLVVLVSKLVEDGGE